VRFLCEFVFESEFDKYKEMAHFEKRIFAWEKPNKFASCVIVKDIAVKHLIKLKEYVQDKTAVGDIL